MHRKKCVYQWKPEGYDGWHPEARRNHQIVPMTIHGEHAYFYRHDARDQFPDPSKNSLKQQIQLVGRCPQTASRAADPYVVEKVLEKLAAQEKAVF